MNKEKPTYYELEKRLAKVEETLRAIRSGEVDVIIGEKCPFILRAKEMEEALIESEERYRSLLENSLVGILILTGPPPKIVFANFPFAKKMGYTINELLAMNPEEIYSLVHPDDRERIFKRFLDRITGKVPPSRYEIRGITKDKRIVWGEVFPTNINYKGQSALQVSLIDITERKLTEENLRLSEEKLRQFFENAPIYCYMISPEGIILDINKSALNTLGYTKEELIGKSFLTIYAPDYHSKAIENLETWRTRGRVDDVEMEILTKKGERRRVILSADAVRDKDGRILHSISVQRDITERRSLEEQLRQAQKMEAIGRLAGGIAHDFNNILSVIKGTSQLLLMDLREGDPLYTNLREIEGAADRAAALTCQLLAFSRKQILEMRVLDLNMVIKNLEKMLRRIIGEDIELVTFLSEDLGRVKADPSQIEQAIINLVVNARDAMPKGGKLTIETMNVELDEVYVRRHIGVKPGSYVMLAISDTGIGMTKEVQERIFEPFFTTKEMGRGTGLGLSTVYGIVNQVGGNIWVYSEPGEGSTFKIYLPRVDEPIYERREEEQKEVPWGSETVLVIEDEETVRRLAVRLLKRQGYKVLEASNGGEAFILCERYSDPIHLILTDVVMPGVSGRELAERLQKIHPEAKVLYMSGYTDNVILHHGILEQGLSFIQKPFTLEALARKVRQMLDGEK